MTEQEAKEILSLSPEEKAILPNLSEVYEIAIQALEDIQKYRTKIFRSTGQSVQWMSAEQQWKDRYQRNRCMKETVTMIAAS